MASSNSNIQRWGLSLILFGVPAIALLVAAWMVWELGQPTGQRTPQIVHIPPGTSARRIGEVLEERGVIHSARMFEWTVRWHNLAHRLEAGTYHLSGTKTTSGVVRDLLKAPVETHRVTIPEGLTRHEIAGLLQRHSVIDSARFTTLTEDPDFIRRLGINAPTLEGYLFPETYFFDVETTPEEVIRLMIAQFHEVFADSLYARLDTLGLAFHQVVILASIVEREAMVAEERPIISAVFQRRLKLNRRLESCATVEYALGTHKKRLTTTDLQVKSPFNTYRHRGLPPGPIGNPGRESILATLYPAGTDYLYFVARGDGHHIFSHTNVEHERAKRALKLASRKRARQQWAR